MTKVKQKHSKPSHERVRELFEYAPQTGSLRWRVVRGNRGAGTTAGSRKGKTYSIRVDGNKFMVRDLVWIWHHGVIPTGGLKHIDEDVLNTSIENLKPRKPIVSFI